jgi:prepilin-type N-terminal cleavage/methylation domain-containing protein
MATKYTILKVLIRNLSKSNHFKKGFTLIELIVGLLIMSIVGGLAMNAFIGASKDFSKDKKNIDSSQNLSAVLEIIGNDIKQAGEGINDGNFPVIEFSFDSSNTTASAAANTDNPQQSSRIIIRKAVHSQLTLCQQIPANINPLPTQLIIADSIVGTDPSCIFTFTSPPSPAPAILPVSSALPNAWQNAIDAREYRCQLDNPNSNYSTTAIDLCAALKPTPPSADLEQLRAAVSDGNGHIRVFNYADDNFLTFSSNYFMSVGNDNAGVSTMSNDVRSAGVNYSSGSPIYLIEERVYALDNDGNLTLAINGGTPQTLIKKISQFNISARLYTNTLDRIINPTPTVPTVTAPATTISNTSFICPAGSNQPTAAAATVTNPQYVCQFNYNTLATDVAMNWKQLAGVRVSLQARYDGTGQNATATDTDKAKLQAAAEFFPRNVLSK